MQKKTLTQNWMSPYIIPSFLLISLLICLILPLVAFICVIASKFKKYTFSPISNTILFAPAACNKWNVSQSASAVQAADLSPLEAGNGLGSERIPLLAVVLPEPDDRRRGFELREGEFIDLENVRGGQAGRQFTARKGKYAF